MKNYTEILKGSTKQRNAALNSAVKRHGEASTKTAALKKETAKILVAMISSGECEGGKIKEHAIKITGQDIRTELQGVYQLVNVFTAVIEKKIELSEDEFDKLDDSKIALIAPFLTKKELVDRLPQAIEKLKTGSAKDIRDLKPKPAPKAPKDPKNGEDKKDGVKIPVQFAVTDLQDGEMLLESKQVTQQLYTDAKQDPAFHAEFMLRFAARVLIENPSIAEALAADSEVTDAAGRIFDALTRTVTTPGQTLEVVAA